ncbi:MAG: hypothetical protein JXR27_06740 [Paludibacteraceae bacterium]|nr:hypothetical protein [Paludibacteraceae bacterium]
MKRKLFVMICGIVPTMLFAIHPMVRNFTRKDYKSGTQNWAITQDNNNIMYFANNDGMLMYDGKNWETTPIRNGTNVRSLVFDGKSRFYASTFNEFGYYKRSAIGSMEYYSLSEELGISALGSNVLFNIHIDSGLVYFQGEKTIYKYDGKNAQALSFEYMIDASAVLHNILFVSSKEAGLFMLNGSMFVRVSGSEILLNKKVVSLLPLSKNKVLIVTAFDGVYLYDGVTVANFATGIDDFLKSNQVFCAATNGDKVVYGTVQRGIAIQDLRDESTMFVNIFSGLQNNTVLSVAFDNTQNLWLGLDKGIDYVLLNSPVTNIFGNNNLYGAGYTSLIKGNKIYFGTNQGLYSSSYPIDNNPMPLQINMIRGMEGQVWSLSEIDNTLFCGDDQGAFIIHADRVERIEGLPGTWNFKNLSQHPDMILGCSYQGLFILKKTEGKWKFSHFLKGSFKESSPLFEEDSDGSIWLSHWQKGLFRLTLNEAKDSITKVVLFDESKGLPAIRNNTMFKVAGEIVFSSERGFFSYNNKLDKMEENTKWNSLFASDPSYMRLHESPSGDVWCVSGRFVGLARKKADNTYEMDSLTYRMLQPKILIGFEHFNFIENEKLLLATEDGFSRIYTGPLKEMNHTFRVLMTSITALNDKDALQERKIVLYNFDQDIELKANFNNVRFDFNAPEYRNEGLIEYSFKLEGYDQNWSDYSFNSFKEYNQLPRGKYVFKLKARDMLDFREAVIFLDFEILPAWYETQLAFGIYIIWGIVILILLIVFINYRSGKGAAEMKKIKEKEMQEQKKIFDEETQAKKREIKELKNQQLQYELRHKSQELASSTMNLIRKNEILLEIVETINKTTEDIQRNTDLKVVVKRLANVERNIRQNIQNDDNWKKFEENFDLVYENYLRRLGESYPDLNITDKKICAYIKMGLSSKDMAPLLNMSVRSIETNRYRIRKKLDLEREVNLSEYLQKF